MGNKLKSPTMIGHLSLSDSSADDYLYVQGAPITGGAGGGTKLYKYIVPVEEGTTLYFITPIRKEYTYALELINDSISILANIEAISPTMPTLILTAFVDSGAVIRYPYYDGETGVVEFVNVGLSGEDELTYTVEEL